MLYYGPLSPACPYALSSCKEVSECTGGGGVTFVCCFFFYFGGGAAGGTDRQSFLTNLESKIDNTLKKKKKTLTLPSRSFLIKPVKVELTASEACGSSAATATRREQYPSY